jgi:hypothetical protein
MDKNRLSVIRAQLRDLSRELDTLADDSVQVPDEIDCGNLQAAASYLGDAVDCLQDVISEAR